MKFILPLFIITINCYSQHTERFNELVKTIKKDSVKQDSLFFKNGDIEFLAEKSFYTFNEEAVMTYSGETKTYYASGIVARHDMQDDFGHWIWSKYYNRKGILTKEWITTEIDTRAKNIEEFFKSRFHIDFKRTIKHYKYSKKTDGRYPCKIEYLTSTDNIDGGKIEFLNANGDVKRTKILKNKVVKNVW
ncbi:hypothetical protein [uncultured Kriegella sp.]|uniref:hypothetical protein n=1 Tax=uncultured Kriegella sp. TaxID=1798910 RepID=UPI0030DB0468|tara:strand:+ start:790 stop:1359 length:570 start_codon:yes stop_codon:yes gene_type:complete